MVGAPGPEPSMQPARGLSWAPRPGCSHAGPDEQPPPHHLSGQRPTDAACPGAPLAASSALAQDGDRIRGRRSMASHCGRDIWLLIFNSLCGSSCLPYSFADGFYVDRWVRRNATARPPVTATARPRAGVAPAYTHACACMCMCTYVCVCAHVCMCTFACVSTFMPACAHTCMYTCTCVCTHMLILLFPTGLTSCPCPWLSPQCHKCQGLPARPAGWRRGGSQLVQPLLWAGSGLCEPAPGTPSSLFPTEGPPAPACGPPSSG